MYDENKWNEMNNENEKKDGGEPVNAQNAQNAQQPQNRPQDAQQSQGQSEHTGRQIYGRLGGAQSGQAYNGNAQNQNQNGSYYGGQQHQQYYGNQNQYTNPYQQYDYYQGHGQNPNQNGNSHHAPKKNDVRSQPCGEHPVPVPEFPGERFQRDDRSDFPGPGGEHLHIIQQRCCY